MTTAFGLFIGIPTLFFYNYFTKKSSELAMALDGVSDRIVVMFDKLKKKSSGSKGTPATKPVANPQPQQTSPPDTSSDWNF